MLESSPCPLVLLIHGIWNPRAWLLLLAKRIRAAGFDTELFGYSSVFGSPGTAISQLAARLGRCHQDTFLIGHSLGGLIALETLRQHPELSVPKLVCLGSPLQGSSMAQALIRRGWGGWTLGGSAALLQSGCAPWQGRARVGMVAGSLARGFGRLLTGLEGPTDGTVTIAETHLPGLADHCIVNTSHSGLVLSAEAAQQSVHFLQHGRFAAASLSVA